MFKKKKPENITEKQIDDVYLFLSDQLTPLLHSNEISKGTKKLLKIFLKQAKKIDDDSTNEFIEIISELSEVIRMENMMSDNESKINSMVGSITDMLENLLKAKTGEDTKIEQIKITKIDPDDQGKAQMIGMLGPKKAIPINDMQKKRQWISKQLELVISKNFITMNNDLYDLFVNRRNFELKEANHNILDPETLHVAILVDRKTKTMKIMYLKSPETSELYPFCFELISNGIGSMVEDDVAHFHELTNNIFLDKSSYIIPFEYDNGENVFVSGK